MKKIIVLLVLAAVLLSSCTLIEGFKQGAAGAQKARNKVVDERFDVSPGGIQFYESLDAGTYNVSIRSTKAIGVYAFKTMEDYRAFKSGEDAEFYEDCSSDATSQFSKVCTFDNNMFVLAIVNFDKISTSRVIVEVTKAS